MTQCVAKTKDGNLCQIPAKAGKKYCHIHMRQRMWQWVFSSAGIMILVGAISFLSDIVGLLNYFHVNPPNSYPHSSATPITLSPTQTQIIIITATPKGTLHRVRFVAGPIPAGEWIHTVYYSIDNGEAEHLATAGAKIDKIFYVTFTRSIRIWIDSPPGTFLNEKLEIDGLEVASGSVDNNGLTYQVP